MSKKVSFGAKPTHRKAEPQQKAKAQAEQWVQHRATEGTKRLTLDLPASLHRRIKISCASRDTRMVEEIRELLEKHYPPVGNVSG